MDELRSTIFSAGLRRLLTEALQPGGRGAGHLNFASGRSTRSPDTDYTGRYGFRCVRNRSGVRDILERARRQNK